MDLTYPTVRVLGSNGKSREFNPLVDTGSVYSWIDADSLRELGIVPEAEKKKFRTIEGAGSFSRH